MTVFANPVAAIAFGAFILCAEICLHLGDIVSPSSWVDVPVHDLLAGGFLIAAGITCRRDWTLGRPYQAAAWAFMASLLFGAFGAHWEEWKRQVPGDDVIPSGPFLVILAALLTTGILGLIGTLVRRG